MAERFGLKEVERRAWTSYFEDGLWDIFLGGMVLIGGIRSLSDNVWYTLLILPLILVLPFGKRFITTPRLGHVKFGPSPKAKREKAVVALIISVLAIFALLLLPNSGLALPPKTLISPMMAVWIAVIFGVLAYYLDFWRLFMYGLLFAISEVLSGLFGGYIGAMAQTISGIGVLLIGFFVLARFLRKYPQPVEATSYVKG
jgi:MFS family permease